MSDRSGRSEAEPCSERVPLDERMHAALMDAGLDEGEASAALEAVLPLLAEDLDALAARVEWRFRSMSFSRSCESSTRLHPSGESIREYVEALVPRGRRA